MITFCFFLERLRSNPISTPNPFPLPLTLTPSKEGGGGRGRNGIGPYNKYICQKKEKQYISVGTVRMFKEPSAEH